MRTTLAKIYRRFPAVDLLSEAIQYKFRDSEISVAPSPLALKNSRLSSAIRRWFTGGADGATWIPLWFDDRLLWFRRHERPSAAIKKR
jgi:hypothetical protein